MIVGSISENKSLEKRIAITPEVAKKYINLGAKVLLIENYGSHLGFEDADYKKLGVNILKTEKEILSSSDIIIQLALLSDEKFSLIKENQILIGVLNPYNNKDRIENLLKKKN